MGFTGSGAVAGVIKVGCRAYARGFVHMEIGMSIVGLYALAIDRGFGDSLEGPEPSGAGWGSVDCQRAAGMVGRLGKAVSAAAMRGVEKL